MTDWVEVAALTAELEVVQAKRDRLWVLGVSAEEFTFANQERDELVDALVREAGVGYMIGLKGHGPSFAEWVAMFPAVREA